MHLGSRETGKQEGLPAGAIPSRWRLDGRFRWWLGVLGLAAFYYTAARLGQLVAIPPGNVTAVWPPSGIALAAVLLLGYRLWPGIWLGGFAANAWLLLDFSRPEMVARGALACVVLGFGHTAQAVLGARLLRDPARPHSPFERTRDVLRFFALSPLMCLVSSSIGVSTLWLTGLTATDNVGPTWLTWWLGDTGGVILMTPLLVLWASPSRSGSSHWQRLEALALLASTVTYGWGVLSSSLFSRGLPLGFTVIPFLVWSALRFTPRETATVVFLLNELAIQGAACGLGAFAGHAEHAPWLIVQAFVLITSVTGLVLATMVQEGRQAQAALRQSGAELEQRVAARTSELARANATLQADLVERKRMEAALRESEERLRIIYNESGVGIALVNLEGRPLLANPACQKMLGYTEAELQALVFTEFTHPEDRDLDLSLFRELVDGKRGHYRIERRFFRKDGGLIWANLSVTAVRDEAGKPQFAISLVDDITQRKQTEETLRESNEKFRQLADNITDAFWIRSPDLSEVQYLSPAFEKIWGRPVASLYAHPENWVEYILPEDRERVVNAFANLAGETKSLDIEYRIVRPDGEVRWVRARGFQVRNAANQLIRHAGIVTDITERKQAEQELKFKNTVLSTQQEVSIDGILVVDEHARILSSNRRFAEMWGIPSELIEQHDDTPLLQFVTNQLADPAAFLQRVRYLYEHRQEISREEVALKDGRIFDRYSAPMIGPDGQYFGRVWYFRDLTERKRLEARLFQAQKLETIGRLAGGIAHEFNNIMTTILGQSELVLEELPPGHPLSLNAMEIRKSAGRAAKLTQQLLAYGRKQILRPEILNLNKILASMEIMLPHLLGSDVDVRIVPGNGLGAVKADAGQIEEVLLNLAINAREAMPRGGKLTLESGNVILNEECLGPHPELKPGDYVMLAMTDTGTGMSEELRQRVFEPFFTTKEVGQGPGLGLATCHGIIKQSGGHINVYSEPGKGTTFKVYLPRVEPPPPRPAVSRTAPPAPTETILLVEDDPALREMAGKLLERRGYQVLIAADGENALSLINQPGVAAPDLLFTDLVMPRMDGKELFDRLHARHPGTRVLFASAYPQSAMVHQGVLDARLAFLQKPFTPEQLLEAVRRTLDA